MPYIIACPECQRKLRVPDDAFGRDMACPMCKHRFPALPPSAQAMSAIPPDALPPRTDRDHSPPHEPPARGRSRPVGTYASRDIDFAPVRKKNRTPQFVVVTIVVC